jgi:hypothetical protein
MLPTSSGLAIATPTARSARSDPRRADREGEVDDLDRIGLNRAENWNEIDGPRENHSNHWNDVAD